MKVFISYSREDSSIVHLLDYALTSKNVACIYDKLLTPGQEFSKEIQDMIYKSDVLIVPWTKNASKSNWVNQEIGYAAGLKKTIIPIGFEKDNLPKGMISSIQSYVLFDYDNPKKTIKGLIKAIKTGISSDEPKFLLEKGIDLDYAIEGKQQRTHFVIETLKGICKLKNDITIYCQAALSTFSIAKDDSYRRICGHPKEYMDLLIEEREMFEQLLTKSNIELKMILWPIKRYNKQLLEIRYRTLIKWMKDIHANPPKAKVDFVCSEYKGQNRLIISKTPNQDIIFEGIKRKETPGYEINILSKKKSKIKNAISEFEDVFQSAYLNNYFGLNAISEIERMQKRHLQQDN